MASLGTTLHERKAAWADAVQGVADMLGVEIDPSTKDINRGFFISQLPYGSAHKMYINQGRPLRFDEIPQPLKSSSGGKRSGQKKRRPDVISEDGTNVSALYDRYGKRWMLADIADQAGLETSANVSNGGGKFHVRCPFADGHTESSDDGATFVMNAEDSHIGFAVADCQHGTCKSANQGGKRHLVEYLGAWIDAGLLDAELLEDPAFMIPMSDNGNEEKFFRLTPDETKGQAEARAYLRERLETVDGESQIAGGAIEGAIDLLVSMGLSPADARVRVADAKVDIERQINERTTDRQRDPVNEARREARGEASVPSVLAPLYDESLVDADGFLLEPDDAPELYRSCGINPSNDDAYIRMQLEIKDQMFHELVARFSYIALDGEAKLAIRQEQGTPIRLWKDATLGKLYLNRAVSYWDRSGTRPKVKQFKPTDVFAFARQRETFFDTCFEPDPARAKIATQRGAYNLWNGFAVDPKPGDWSLLRAHIKDNLCNGDVKIFNFVMTWLASLFARPGVKVPSSIAVIGEQGVGKSKVFDWIRRGIGGAALKVSAGRHLTGNFNAHLDGLIFLVCEEAFWGGDKQAAGVMKDLISSETLQIEGKFANLVERPNYVNMVFVSNNKWSVPVDGEDARRFLVLICSDAMKQNAKYFGAIDDQMENGGLEAMVYELMYWNPADVGMTWHNLRNPPATDSLREQAGMGLNGPAERLVSILESGVLSGRTQDGEVFYYDLFDDKPVDVARHHLVAALVTNVAHGNLTDEMKVAISKFLGEDADHGNNKAQIKYLGEHIHGDDTRQERKTQGRVRYVTIPALSTIKDTLARYGRG